MAPNDSSLEVNVTRDTLNDVYAAQVWPTILFLSLVVVVGSCGNFIVCVVYRCNVKKVSNRFILALAVVDLINCLTSVPAEIADLRYKYTFGEVFLCPAMRMFVAFSSLASASILVAISIDRFKKICKPFGPQTGLKEAAAAILICCGMSICVALPAAFINGKRTVVVDGVVGADCSIADKYVQTISPKIYNAFFFFLFICACVIIIVIYALIWRRLRKQKAYRQKAGPGLEMTARVKFHRGLTSDDVLTSTTDTQDTVTTDNNVNGVIHLNTHGQHAKTGASQNTEACPTISSLVKSTAPGVSSGEASALGLVTFHQSRSDINTPVTSIAHSLAPSPKKIHQPSAKTSSVVDRTTLMMFLVTVVFICSFLPYIILTTVHAVNNHVFRDLSGVQLAVYHIFLRCHFLNSTLNPFIYSFCGQEFRNQLRKTFQRICKWRR